MKILICYFTGTGSTAKIANDLGKILIELGHNVEFLHMKRSLMDNLPSFHEYDLIGIGTPTYSYRAPRLVTKLMREFGINNKPYFLFLTCGGQPGHTFWKMYQIMHRKNNTLIASYKAISSNNLRSWRPKSTQLAPYGDGFGDNIELQTNHFAAELLQNYEEIFVTKTKKEKKIRINPLWSIYCALLTYGFQMKTILGNKRVDKEKCTKCEICAKRICPSGCITLDPEGYPLFDEKKCVGCQGCVSLCPTLAIDTKLCNGKHPYTLYSKYVYKDLPI